MRAPVNQPLKPYVGICIEKLKKREKIIKEVYSGNLPV